MHFGRYSGIALLIYNFLLKYEIPNNCHSPVVNATFFRVCTAIEL